MTDDALIALQDAVASLANRHNMTGRDREVIHEILDHVAEQADRIAALTQAFETQGTVSQTAMNETLLALRKAEAERDALLADAEYYKWRLAEIIPLFEEARDALPAISLVSAKLHNIDLSLGERMDRAGTRTRLAAKDKP